MGSGTNQLLYVLLPYIKKWLPKVFCTSRLLTLSSFNPLTPMSDRQNFSLQYQYNIKQTRDENKEKY